MWWDTNIHRVTSNTFWNKNFIVLLKVEKNILQHPPNDSGTSDWTCPISARYWTFVVRQICLLCLRSTRRQLHSHDESASEYWKKENSKEAVPRLILVERISSERRKFWDSEMADWIHSTLFHEKVLWNKSFSNQYFATLEYFWGTYNPLPLHVLRLQIEPIKNTQLINVNWLWWWKQRHQPYHYRFSQSKQREQHPRP